MVCAVWFYLNSKIAVYSSQIPWSAMCAKIVAFSYDVTFAGSYIPVPKRSFSLFWHQLFNISWEKDGEKETRRSEKKVSFFWENTWGLDLQSSEIGSDDVDFDHHASNINDT